MARYIDADKVMEEIASTGGHNLCEWSTLGVKALIDRQPTADVAPRAEVAREIFEKIENHLFVIAPIEEFDGWARIQLADIMRLKKKYTQSEPPKENT